MNQGEENNNIDIEKEHDSFLKERVSVHTMPKGFRRADVAGEARHMSTGLLVMVGGLVLLLGLGFLAYYLVIKKDFFSLTSTNDAAIEEEMLNLADGEKNNINPATTTIATTTTLVATSSSDDIISEATSSIDDLINSFNQELGTSSLSTSSEAVDGSLITTDTEQSSTSLDAIDAGEEAIKKEVVIREATDADADGLSDLEETLLGTDPSVMDTDSDGYSDFQELDKMYNPAGKGDLASNKAITSYANPTHQYSLIHPTAWVPGNFDKDDSIIFKIDGLQFVQITVQDNPDKQLIEDWYKKQFDVDVIDDLQKVANKKGWTGVVSKDGLYYYLAAENAGEIYIISYNLGISNALNYQKLFEMMVNSLDVTN